MTSGAEITRAPHPGLRRPSSATAIAPKPNGGAADTEPVVVVRDLVKHFRRADGSDVPAVDHVSLTVQPGQFVVLLGPSGCGKTTLLRCIAGLERPDAGEIDIHGEPMYVPRRGIDQRPQKRRLSMIFQSYALWPHMTAFQNVAYPLRARGAKGRDVPERVREALAMVGVPELEGQYPSNMSGGQQQRVALARTLVAGDRLILFDEPLSNVDAKVRERLRIELVEMQRRLGFSALYVTHDQVEAMQLAHLIAVMRSGRVAQLGTPTEVYTRPQSRYVANFVGSVNELDGKVLDRLPEGRLRVETALGNVVSTADDAGVAAGDRVVLLCRPESCTLGEAPINKGLVVDGVVEAVMFAGSHVEYVVRLPGRVTFTVWRFSLDLLHVGDPVTVSVGTDDLRAVPANDSAAATRGTDEDD